jgi:hypothetical protein
MRLSLLNNQSLAKIMFDIRYTKLIYRLSKLSQHRRKLIPSLWAYARDVILPGTRTQRANSRIYISVAESMGRYLFILLKFLTIRGATVTVLSRMSIWDFVDRYGKMSLDLEGVVFSKHLPSHSEDKILIVDRVRPELMARKWQRQIYLNFDISSPEPQHDNWFVMPYSMHPLVYILGQDEKVDQLRQETRTIKVLFAGNIRGRGYESFKNTYMRTKFRKLLRPEIIATVLSNLGSQVMLVDEEEQMQRVLSGWATDKCVIVDSSKVRVQPANWLRFVANSEFFLCPPGVSMPLCHNVIEAMAVGSIPILNYGEWFQPSLQDGCNCVEFDDANDLIRKVTGAMRLGRSQTDEMRRNVIKYYQDYLAPERFEEKVMTGVSSETTLFVNVEQFHRLARVDQGSVAVAGNGGSG